MENNKGTTVEASKQFAVPVEKLFSAWNDPGQLKQWWKPMGNHLKEVVNELKPGGSVRYTFDDNTLIISGNYEEAKENEKLVYSWNWEFPENAVKNAAYKLTVEFLNKDNGSEIHVTQQANNQEETLQPNEHGWEQGLSDLEKFLNGGRQQEKNNAPEVSGYQETPEQQKVGG